MRALPKVFPVTCHTDFVGAGSTFVVIQGQQENGLKYLEVALQKGATSLVLEQNVVLTEQQKKVIKKYKISVEYVKNARAALAQLSAQAAGYPANTLKLLGVTGTKGKSSTVHMLYFLLQQKGYKVAQLGTVENKIHDTILPKNLTTPQPDYLHQFFKLCVESGVEYVVMEVAAQALTFKRLETLQFEGVIFTNLDREHGELYPDMEKYFETKCQLFDFVKPGGCVIVNQDDAWGKRILELEDPGSSRSLHSVRMTDSSQCHSEAVKLVNEVGYDGNFQSRPSFQRQNGSDGVESSQEKETESHDLRLRMTDSNQCHSEPVKLINEVGMRIQELKATTYFPFTNYFITPKNFPGFFNQQNSNGAITLLETLGISFSDLELQKLVDQIPALRGRLERYNLCNGAQVYIDYAHTPGSFLSLFKMVKGWNKKMCVVFGAGGGKDTSKRPLMGSIAAEYADLVVITSDNPRYENPEIIAQQIIAGIPEKQRNKVVIKLDRKEAIEYACHYSDQKWVILLLGKGPDEYQIIEDKKEYFSESLVLKPFFLEVV